MKKLSFVFALLFLPIALFNSSAQGVAPTGNMAGSTALHNLLMMAPDSRSGGMGDVGVATAPDLFSQQWNPAKYAFIEEDAGVGLSFVPWNRKLVNDEYLVSVHGFKRIDRSQALGFSFRYSSLGLYNWTDDQGGSLGSDKPNEMAIDLSYSRMLSDYLSAAVAFRYMRYDYKFDSERANEKDGGFATDVAIYYNRPVYLSGNDGYWAFGMNISNIGPKMNYLGSDRFIPTNFRIGSTFGISFQEDHEISFSLDLNKLLVPTPPLRHPVTQEIIDGKDDNVSTIKGILQSFNDAPDGFSEELKEIGINFGVEYWYKKSFVARTGYAYEDAGKGYRKYFALGAGYRYNQFGIDLSYLTSGKTNPLTDALRFSFLYHFGKNPGTLPARR